MPIADWRADALPENTRSVLDQVSRLPALEGFRLVGGTALALRVGHRQSEDIDLLWPGARLPRAAIDSVIEDLDAAGRKTLLATSESVRLDWDAEGLDIDDHQQDWMVDGVKVTLFTTDAAPPASSRRHGVLDVADQDAIFEAKSRLLVKRTATRDLFDIWWFLTHGGHTIHEVVALMRQANPHYADSMIRGRLLPSRAPLADPGVQPLTPGAPADFAALREALRPHVAEWEIALAAQVIADEAGRGSAS
ncbi:MAG: nucleotidyl transferase AbiEii/AbiGii toxin family protein [Alphaproteobacteria bacterium]|nr:nucleotidyl transferase AbiEii/AbiGii toxin family protein [Alphaproteobacteria bacterium]